MKTVVALYDHLSDANAAVRDLVDYGLSRDNISLMANDASGNYSSYLAGTTGSAAAATPIEGVESTASGAATGAGIGAIVGGLGGLLVGLGVLTIPGVGPVLAAGPLATAISALTGAGVGAMAGGAAGGLIGALVDLGLPEETAGHYAEGVRRGGILVTARTEDHQAEDVRRIMNRHGVVNLDDRVRGWREQGWTGYREDVTDRDRDMVAIPTGREDIEAQGHHDTSVQHPQGTATGGDAYQAPQRTDQPMGMASGGEGYVPDTDATGIGTGSVGSYPSETAMGRNLWDTDDRYRQYNPNFEQHYTTTYANRGYNYEYYRPAYYYGYQLANEDRYRDWEWSDLEPEARREWDTRYKDQGAWEDFKDAVQHAWMRVRQGVRETFD